MTKNSNMVEIESAFLNDIVSLIDVVTKRGAFEGSELVTVGSMRQFCIDKSEGNTPTPDEDVEFLAETDK